jgi:hypothetical protein
LQARAFKVQNRLAKWRAVFAGWQLGTRSETDGECQAVRDHREVTLFLRVESNVVMRVLVGKGIVSQDDLLQAIIEECETTNDELEARFPGFSVTDDGVKMKLPEARQTTERMGFPK